MKNEATDVELHSSKLLNTSGNDFCPFGENAYKNPTPMRNTPLITCRKRKKRPDWGSNPRRRPSHAGRSATEPPSRLGGIINSRPPPDPDPIAIGSNLVVACLLAYLLYSLACCAP